MCLIKLLFLESNLRFLGHEAHLKLLLLPVGLARHCAEEERLLPLQVPRAAAGLVLEAGLLWGGEYYDSSLYYLPFCYKYYAQFCDSVFRI